MHILRIFYQTTTLLQWPAISLNFSEFWFLFRMKNIKRWFFSILLTTQKFILLQNIVSSRSISNANFEEKKFFSFDHFLQILHLKWSESLIIFWKSESEPRRTIESIKVLESTIFDIFLRKKPHQNSLNSIFSVDQWKVTISNAPEQLLAINYLIFRTSEWSLFLSTL